MRRILNFKIFTSLLPSRPVVSLICSYSFEGLRKDRAQALELQSLRCRGKRLNLRA